MARNKGKKRSKYVSEQIKKEYKRQRSRIQNFIRNASKRGYQFQENVLPKIPKTVTQQSINRLQKITPATLYEKARVYFNETEFYTGTEYRHIENVVRGRKASETRHYNKYDIKKQRTSDYEVIRRVEQLVKESAPKSYRSRYTPEQKSLLLTLIKHGKQWESEYASYLLENETDNIAPTLNDIQYESDQEENLRLFDRLIYYLGFEGGTIDAETLDNIREEVMENWEDENPFL